MNETATTPQGGDEKLVVAIGYVLTLIGPANGLTMLIAVILAYVRKDSAPEWLRTHYIYQIRTFWYGLALLVGAVVCMLTIILLWVGVLILLLFGAWVVVRAVIGLARLISDKPHHDPRAFLL